MSFAKPETKERDDGPSLRCSVSGCSNRWSVKVDGESPKCSYHQWPEKVKFGKTSTHKPIVQSYYDTEDF
jgi:hypothetical protein